jgi:hypothetical protein
MGATRTRSQKSPTLSACEVRIDDLVDTLVSHPLYQQVRGERELRYFMQSHVYCVWDFQSLLKALQRHLTCVEVPWLPTADGEARRLINEIVLDEERDLMPDGGYLSHFELYLQAMDQCGADKAGIMRLMQLLWAGSDAEDALASTDLPPGVAGFVTNTLRVARSSEVHRIAAAFTYGRDDVIPAMFQEMVRSLAREDAGRWSLFLHYLNRHIEHDGERHGPLSRALVQRLCAQDNRLWAEANETARASIEARLRLWDSISAELGDFKQKTSAKNTPNRT